MLSVSDVLSEGGHPPVYKLSIFNHAGALVCSEGRQVVMRSTCHSQTDPADLARCTSEGVRDSFCHFSCFSFCVFQLTVVFTLNYVFLPHKNNHHHHHQHNCSHLSACSVALTRYRLQRCIKNKKEAKDTQMHLKFPFQID